MMRIFWRLGRDFFSKGLPLGEAKIFLQKKNVSLKITTSGATCNPFEFRVRLKLTQFISYVLHCDVFFSMFKNSIFMSCFHLYMAPSQRGRTLLSSYLVQNDCATNKKQSSSHHAHSMSFSVDFSTSSDLENHNYLAQNQFPTFFNTPCLVIFVVLLSSPFWIVLEHTSIREVPILFCFSLGYDQWHLLPSPG